MKTKEFILCAAIDFDGIVICGHGHQDCYEVLHGLLGKNNIPYRRPGREQEGFLTSENRFVDRKEAFRLAAASGQIVWKTDPTKVYGESVLFSDHLY